MATQKDVRKIATSLPNTSEQDGRFAFSVENKGKAKDFAWVWLERVDPKKPRVPQPEVLAVRVANEQAKEMLLEAEPDMFFTEPHYNGFPAVLVRLKKIKVAQLRQLIVDAWRCQAPKTLVREYDES